MKLQEFIEKYPLNTARLGKDLGYKKTTFHFSLYPRSKDGMFKNRYYIIKSLKQIVEDMYNDVNKIEL